MKTSTKIQSVLKLLKESVSDSEQDFTRIKIRHGIFLLAVPMILEMLMESLFAIVDIFFVGKLGEDAIATVGLTEASVMIVYSIGVGASMAATALVARRFGEKEYSKAGTAAFQLILFGFICSLILSAAGIIFASDVLYLMGANPNVIEKGSSYTRIIFAGNTSILLLFMLNGAFRGAGQAQLAMRSLWISNGLNIVLDPILIFGIGSYSGMGLDGAALATTIGRTAGVIFQMYHLFNGKHKLVILKENIKVKFKLLKNIAKISAGGMGQFMIDSAAWIVLTRMTAEFGSVAVAGFTIAFRILIFFIDACMGTLLCCCNFGGTKSGSKKNHAC